MRQKMAPMLLRKVSQPDLVFAKNGVLSILTGWAIILGDI